MTKKDYHALARMMYRQRVPDEAMTVPGSAALVGQWHAILDGLCGVLADDNPRFNRILFEEACMTGRCKGMRG